MPKTNQNSNKETKLFLLIVLLVLVGYLFTSKKSETAKTTAPAPLSAENITDTSSLENAQDKLNSVNIDSLDLELNKLNSDSSAF